MQTNRTHENLAEHMQTLYIAYVLNWEHENQTEDVRTYKDYAYLTEEIQT